MSKRKKIIILSGMVALLVLTGCLNYFLNRTEPGAAAADAAVSFGDYFAASKSDRDSSRADAVMYYEAIIAGEATSAQAKSDAERELATLVAGINTEQRLETLIKALGFDDCLVTVGAENINVILRSPTLTEVEVAQVMEVINSETGKSVQNVRIKSLDL